MGVTGWVRGCGLKGELEDGWLKGELEDGWLMDYQEERTAVVVVAVERTSARSYVCCYARSMTMTIVPLLMMMTMTMRVCDDDVDEQSPYHRLLQLLSPPIDGLRHWVSPHAFAAAVAAAAVAGAVLKT